jgi:oligopeptide/dipeptide ABC transporter ATP-binding protein
METPPELLRIEALKTQFHTLKGVARAVDGVSLTVARGQILGVVGESGCGKSVMAQSIMRLVPEPPGKIVGGRIVFDGLDLVKVPMADMRRIRGNRISMIFQEPMTSLNPVKTVGEQVSEMFRQHRHMSRRQALDEAVSMVSAVQIPEAARRAHQYPHELSGGMRQRVMIAMALACHPELLIADEPTTALDVTVQAQILDLMMQLKTQRGTALMLITHDLGVIAEMADRVVVMYAGRVLEAASTLDLFDKPLHPYTRGLMASVPVIGSRPDRLAEIPGMVPSLYEELAGCRFSPRCPLARDVCVAGEPPLSEPFAGHEVRCLFPGVDTKGFRC